MSEIRNKLKKIKYLRAFVRAIKRVLHTIKRYINKVRAYFYIAKVTPITDKKIKIGFIAQIAWSWDKLQPLYETLRDSKDYDTFLFVVPEEDFKTYEIVPDYTNNYFLKKYPEGIKVLNDFGDCIDIVNFRLDYLFYQRPFDYRIPEMLRSIRMVRYVKCCYLPYGFTASDIFNNNNLKNEFFDNQRLLFMDSDHMCGLFRRRYPLSYSRGVKKIEYLGYPALDKYINWGKKENSEGFVTWTPRWSFDNKRGGSSFLRYKDNFLDLVIHNKGKYIFRPHPLIHAELIDQNIMTETQWQDYIMKLRDNNVIIDIESAIDDILRKTEILITDFSTIIGNFLMMGRPIIYCDNGIVFNPVYQEIQKHLYTAYKWEDVEKIYGELCRGNDEMKASRMQYIEDYMPFMGASKRISEYIKDDARRRGWKG